MYYDFNFNFFPFLALFVKATPLINLINYDRFNIKSI